MINVKSVTMQTFSLPTKIIFGSGCINALAAVVLPFGHRVLLVTGKKSMREGGILVRLEKILGAADIAVFDGVDAEVSTDTVDAARILAGEKKVQVVIGLGGGSSLDCAKAVAGLADKEGKTVEYLYGKKEIASPGLPFIAIPVTAGSGAEVTPNAVLIDREKLIKQSLRSDYLFAKAAVLDPELTLGLPPRITSYCGMDALCQAIESYTSLGANAVTDCLALEAARLIGNSIVAVYRQPDNLVLRGHMLYGSLLAGIVLFNARMGVVHGIAHPLGALYGLPHGLLCGLLLPYAMEFNLASVAGKYMNVGAVFGMNVKGMSEEAAARRTIKKIKAMLKTLDFPQSLKELGVEKNDFHRIIADSMPSGSLKANPRIVAPGDVGDILLRCWKGA